jgi:maltose O-acetyltransferase
MCFLLREYNCTRPHPLDAETRKHLKVPYITIGDDCWIGGNSICPGITIGKGCVIGAGSVVTKDIPDNSLAVGKSGKSRTTTNNTTTDVIQFV